MWWSLPIGLFTLMLWHHGYDSQGRPDARRRFIAAVTARHPHLADVAPVAWHYGRKAGVDPRVIVAVAALEGGNRAPDPERVSLFGVKGEYGPLTSAANAAFYGEPELAIDRDYSITSSTTEERGGVVVREVATFRAYPSTPGVSSVRRAVADWARLVTQREPYLSAGVAKLTDPVAQVRRIAEAGYATGSTWAQKVIGLLPEAT